jgi:hypothetical protein
MTQKFDIFFRGLRINFWQKNLIFIRAFADYLVRFWYFLNFVPGPDLQLANDRLLNK